ncbi:unnamed protein product, partial [Didymodactylos carnosus]
MDTSVTKPPSLPSPSPRAPAPPPPLVIPRKSLIRANNDVENYLVVNPIHQKFLQNSRFFSYFQNSLQKICPIQTEIIQQHLPTAEDNRDDDDNQLLDFNIRLSGTRENIQSGRDVIKILLEKIQTKVYTDEKVKAWFRYPPAISIVQKIMDKIDNVLTVCELIDYTDDDLIVHYFNYTSNDAQEIDKIIFNNILDETILLPLDNQQTIKLQTEINEIIESQQNQETIFVALNEIINRKYGRKNEEQIIIFGHIDLVNKFKKKFHNLIDRYRLITFKLKQMGSTHKDYLLNDCSTEIWQIEEQYRDDGVNIRLTQDEFDSPEYLKDEIESSVNQLLSQSKTKRFKSIELFSDIAEKECLYIKNIAKKNHCYIEIKLKTKLNIHVIPKAAVITPPSSKRIIEQSNLLCISPDVFKRARMTNGGLIEVFIGDIALQKVDTIVVSSTLTGLKEVIIERAGGLQQNPVENEKQFGTFTLTETNAGQLSCKKILFSNWLPKFTSNENVLRKSVQTFISQSIQYATRQQSQQQDMKIESIAFVVPDLSGDSIAKENILAHEMMNETKHQIELKKSFLKISFILLPEQQTLYKQFSTIIETMQTDNNGYAQFYWSTSIMKITLTSSSQEYLDKCEAKLKNYLNRCMIKLEVTKDGFKEWNQHMINAYYKFCKERCVLPQIIENNKEQKLELIGTNNGT